VARLNKDSVANDTSGTPGYMAPEVMCRMEHSFPVDHYAVGVIAYELLVGKRPYNGKNRQEIREQILAK
jgi:serum/glucocorticoid-regulated kinase 2